MELWHYSLRHDLRLLTFWIKHVQTIQEDPQLRLFDTRFHSKASKDLIRKILNTDPNKRFNVADIRSHEWYNQVKPNEMEGIVIGKDRVPVIEEFLSKI